LSCRRDPHFIGQAIAVQARLSSVQ
jgi:hypothetical protein